jgi:PAS domain S-box-containing protein
VIETTDAGATNGQGADGPPAAADGSSPARSLLGLLVEALPVIAWVTDADDRLLAANARWSEYVGEPPVLGQPIDHERLLHPHDLTALRSAWSAAREAGRPYEGAARMRRADDAWRWHLIRAVPAAGPEGVAWLGTSTDIDDERRELHRSTSAAASARRMLALTQALAGARSREDVARVAIRHGRAAFGAPRGYLFVRSADGVSADAVAMTGYPRSVRAGNRRLRLGEDRPVCHAIRSGRELWLEDMAAAASEATRAVATATGSRGTVSMPLVHEGRIVGALGFSFTEPHRWNTDERATVRTVAGLVAQALERVMLAEAREALVADLETQRARLDAVLGQLPSAVMLVDARTRELLMASDMARRFLGPDDAPTRPGTHGGVWDGWRGTDPDGTPYGDGDWPIDRALATGETVQNEEIQVTHADGRSSTVLASAAPIRDRSGRIEAGVVAFTDITERRQALAAQQYIAEVTAVLASSLDYEDTLTAIARLAVPRIADWCSIELLEGDELRQIVVEHPDPAKSELARDLRRRYPIDMNSDVGAPAVVRTGEVQLVPEIPPALLDKAATTDELRIILNDLGLRSILCVPLRGARGTIGAITFVGAESGRRFGPEDVPFAEGLAGRAAAAIENARLYRDADRFRRMVDAHGDAILQFDPQSLRIAYANHGAATATGRSADELAGSSMADLFDARDAGRFTELVRPIAEGRAGTRTLVLRMAGPDGAVPMEVLVESVRLSGEPPAALAIARNVSDRLDTQARLRRLAEAEHTRAAELNAVIRAMGEGVLVCATDGTVTLANPAVRDVLGGAAPATYGQLLSMIEDSDDAPGLGTRGGPVELRLAGDEERWVELATYPVGALPGQAGRETIVVVRDVTATRLSQALRETFVGVLSHELRTPITTIFGGAKILARDGNLGEEQRQAVFEDIHVEAERLHRLVEDVIALTRFGEDGIDIGHEPVLLQRILPGIVASEQARWPGATFSVEVMPGLPTVVADPTYVEQVVRNLLTNAAKYGGDGVRVEAVAQREGDEVAVRILDDGPGFQHDEGDRLFELYFRSSRTATRVSGAGIGLFVCARLIRAMGGRIWAAPRPGGGAEFGFALRRMDEDDQA